jgi:N-carbamoyl-L-amino-acid hydrolase
LDLRAPTDAQRDALVPTCWTNWRAKSPQRRGLRYTLEESMRAAAAPSAPALAARWERAVDALGVPVFRMPSGAGHDAMKLHEVMPQAMLFVRGENSGISHNPLESTTNNDMQLAVEAFSPGAAPTCQEPSHDHPHTGLLHRARRLDRPAL